jgi:hypothetical protein
MLSACYTEPIACGYDVNTGKHNSIAFCGNAPFLETIPNMLSEMQH